MAVATGIGYRVDFPGLVPVYEEYAAMIHANYNSLDWHSLAMESRAQAVAFYRLARLIHLHEQDAVARDAERKQRRANLPKVGVEAIVEGMAKFKEDATTFSSTISGPMTSAAQGGASALSGLGEIAAGALAAGFAIAAAGATALAGALVFSVGQAMENEQTQARLGVLLKSTAQAADEQAKAYVDAQGKFVTSTAASEDELSKWQDDLATANAKYADLQERLKDKEPTETQKLQLEKLRGSIANLTDKIQKGGQVITTSLVDALGLVPPAAGFTLDELNKLAQQFTGLAGGSDDVILAIEEMALRMGTVSKDEMPAFIQTTLDLAAATGQDATSAARLLAQAQEDPISALGRFRRMGILFNQTQEDQIKALVKAGDTAGATALVMDRLAEATGGAAQAQANTLAGQWEILKGTIGEAAESIGMAFLPVLHELTDKILPVLIPFPH